MIHTEVSFLSLGDFTLIGCVNVSLADAGATTTVCGGKITMKTSFPGCVRVLPNIWRRLICSFVIVHRVVFAFF